MFGIKIAALESGLTVHTVRMWENRYAAITPERTSTNRRLYSEECISRLKYLAELTRGGHAISQIAHLSDLELENLFDSLSKKSSALAESLCSYTRSIEQLIAASAKFDQVQYDEVLDRAAIEWGYSGVLEKVLIPFIQCVGNRWEDGTFSTAQEHAASSFMKSYLLASIRSFTVPANAPKVLVATPPGQLHELGAIVASGITRKMGLDVVYLGSSIPVEEIVGAADEVQAVALLLSIIYPLDDPDMEGHLRFIKKYLSPSTQVIVGSPSESKYAGVLSEAGFIHLDSMSKLSSVLKAIRVRKIP